MKGMEQELLETLSPTKGMEQELLETLSPLPSKGPLDLYRRKATFDWRW